MTTSSSSPVYDPSQIESKWYQYWLENGFFKSTPDNREPYTIVIPPPNVTGVLHMGHMLNNTIQDILVRRARMLGKNACWVRGTDHASIATEAKVVARLKELGRDKSQLTREEFQSLRTQIASLKIGRGGRGYLPYAFTEQGVAMLSSVLRSDCAVAVNIAIMRAFVRLRETLSLHKELAHKLADLERKIENHDENIRSLFDAIRQLMTPPETPRREIGFHVKEDSVPYRVKTRKPTKAPLGAKYL